LKIEVPYMLGGFLVLVEPDGGIITICAFIRRGGKGREEEEAESSNYRVHKGLLSEHATSW
jgi:hypothetical protein